MNKIPTCFVVISDFRALPFSAAVDIYKKNKNNGNAVDIVVSERNIDSEDYGTHLPRIYKRIKYLWLRVRFGVLFIPTKKDTKLSGAEKKGITSSLQSITCDSSASDLNYPRLYEKLSQASLGAKEVEEFILSSKQCVNKVYLFNGRTAGSYPIARGCFDRRIAVEFYEYGHRLSGYKLLPFAPHNTTQLGRSVSDYRKTGIISAPDLHRRATAWKWARLSNPNVRFYRQSTGAKFDVVIFLGSDHEYTCLDEDISGYQYMGNYKLVTAVLQKYGNKAKIAVRAHPNQTADKNHRSILSSVEELCVANRITYYPPDSGISSYDLIRNSKITAVEFSSIAYDAILLGGDVDLFNDLDLKHFLQSLSQKQRLDTEFVSSYTCELMCLYDDLFFERFDKLTYSACRVFAQFEWRFIKSYAPTVLG